MVRFARAHGSKSSNERQPEEASSWQDLKQQLLDKQSVSEDGHGTNQKDVRKDFIFVKKEKNNETQWAEFEEKPHNPQKKVKKEKRLEKSSDNERRERKLGRIVDKLHKKQLKKIDKDDKKAGKKLSKMLKNLSLVPDSASPNVTNGIAKSTNHVLSPIGLTLSKRKKRKMKDEKKGDDKYDKMSMTDIATGIEVMETEPRVLTKKQKRRKKHLQKKNSDVELVSNPSSITIEPAGPTTMDMVTAVPLMLSKRQKRNLKRLGNETCHAKRKRPKPEEVSTTMMINGQEVEVIKFDGFPVRKEDADNLTELRKQMVANGIPLKEMKNAMKLERRKAEKNLARARRNVCFHCRKGGHMLSECPALGEASADTEALPSSGICFKCGSLEHTHFECRVNRGQEFRFAKCFICNEQGHISRQCPDNPRGLYPKGGACKVCGDVTHLKKDCPDLMTKKEENNITLETVVGNKLELLDEDIKKDKVYTLNACPKNKIIKF